MPDPDCTTCIDHLPAYHACHARVRRGFNIRQCGVPRDGAAPAWCPKRTEPKTKEA